MATTAHCAYCFEILAADLEDREPLEYNQVLDLWSQYQLSQAPKALQDGQDDGEEADTAMTEAGEEQEEEEEEEEQEPGTMAQPVPRSANKGKLYLPSISRLQAASPASASSASSTPSSLSTASSSAALRDKSKSSSNSSFFSLGRSKQPSPLLPPKEEGHPLFVTWNTISQRSGHKSLRGCIGTFEAHELGRGLRDYALTAALDDTRFAPISLQELPSLSTAVTFLTNFTPCADPFDWQIGTHGLRISFSHHGKRFGATYLPDVAAEQGWTKEETLVSLMRKAGWGGRSRDLGDMLAKLNVTRYEGKKMSLDYAEWKDWRRWVLR